jgi:lipopolysaccharide/colanic/teichoic acid biosynthesis glycosyltransferase
MTDVMHIEEFLGPQLCAGEAIALPWRALDVQYAPSFSSSRSNVQTAKRAIDLTLAIVMIILCAPLCLLVAALVKLSDGGPVIFWQVRVGRSGREFLFPKFRSMKVGAEESFDELALLNDHAESITFKMRRDPRVTRIGRIIRRLSIDELPQLWCVLKGEMSLVGPRPALPREVIQYDLIDRRRLEATPGLTCIWQVSGRGDVPFDEQVKLDIQYIETQTLALDCRLILRTIPAVLSGRGAY